jgi:hypothetical protein
MFEVLTDVSCQEVDVGGLEGTVRAMTFSLSNLPRADAFADPDDVLRQAVLLAAERDMADAAASFGSLAALFDVLEVRDCGRLGRVDSPNHVRLVESAGGDRFVLKLVGCEHGDEIGTLLAWQRAGCAGSLTAVVVSSGHTGRGERWALFERFGNAICEVDAADMFDWVLDVMPSLSAVARPGRAVRDGREVMRSCLLAAASSGSRPLMNAATAVSAAFATFPPPDRLAHGNLDPSNVLSTVDGLRVVSPVGMLGYASSDVARFTARSSLAGQFAGRVDQVAARAGLGRVELGVLTAGELVAVALSHVRTGDADGVVETLCRDAAACVRWKN